jgi:hypothetical protein
MEYVVGVDAAIGTRHGDFQVGQILRRDTLDQVAVYSNKTDIGLFAQDIERIGRYFNDAWICPERNAAGEAVIFELTKIYHTHRIYHTDWARDTKRGNRPKTEAYGFYTSAKSKSVLVTLIQEYLRGGEGLVLHLETVKQMMTYQKFTLDRQIGTGFGYGAGNGEHDDLVTAFGLALEMDRVLPPFVSRSEQITRWAKQSKSKINQSLPLGWPA